MGCAKFEIGNEAMASENHEDVPNGVLCDTDKVAIPALCI